MSPWKTKLALSRYIHKSHRYAALCWSYLKNWICLLSYYFVLLLLSHSCINSPGASLLCRWRRPWVKWIFSWSWIFILPTTSSSKSLNQNVFEGEGEKTSGHHFLSLQGLYCLHYTVCVGQNVCVSLFDIRSWVSSWPNSLKIGLFAIKLLV